MTLACPTIHRTQAMPGRRLWLRVDLGRRMVARAQVALERGPVARAQAARGQRPVAQVQAAL
jgi:hypothetical protein